MHLDDPTFPPLLSGHAVKAPLRAFESACEAANMGTAGAGEIFWGRDTARLDWAIVLEPDVGATQAQQMLIVCQVAFADAFGAIAPPEVAVQFRWPGDVLINGAKAGQMRIAMGANGDDGCPKWLCVGLALNIRRQNVEYEPGSAPDETDLTEEGCAELDRTQLIESVSRHFLSQVHSWNEDGFGALHETWMSKAVNVGDVVNLNLEGQIYEGTFLTIDDEANLILKSKDATISLPMADFVEHTEQVA